MYGEFGIGDLKHLERSLGALDVAEADVHPRELVQHRVELGRFALDLRVGLARLLVLLHLVEETADRHPREIDHVAVLVGVGGELGHRRKTSIAGL